ncbi:hypothetical protein SALBM135S_03706 [Streptomyces alboniger]
MAGTSSPPRPTTRTTASRRPRNHRPSTRPASSGPRRTSPNSAPSPSPRNSARFLADELGITDALDCFTTGALGACGATAANVITSLIGGGPVGKLVAKYWNRLDKAYALGKRIVSLGKQLWGAFKDWRKSNKAAGAAESCLRKDASNSFTPKTRVLMANGKTKAIEDVDIGDKVLATDPKTGRTKVETVTAEIKGKGLKHLVRLTIDVDGKKGSKTASVTATDGHPFGVPELGKWLDATDLKAGGKLRTDEGALIEITAVKRWTSQGTTGAQPHRR